MKTIVIWDDTEANLKFFVHESDIGLKSIDGVYLNLVDVTDAQEELIYHITARFSKETSGDPDKMLNHFPIDDLIFWGSGNDLVEVIVCGFVP